MARQQEQPTGSPTDETGLSCVSRQLAHMSPLLAMKYHHEEKLMLCRALEQIADSLPHHVDRLECLTLASTMLPLLRTSQSLEENTIFPVYEQLARGCGMSSSTERLRAEHIEDECFAAELTDILLKIGHGGTLPNAEAFGFMLRGFFESLRRHVAFEDEHIAPMLRKASLRSPTAPAADPDCQ